MNAYYKSLLAIILGICTLKKGPQDIPESYALQRQLLWAYILLGCMSIFVGSQASIFVAIGQAFLETFALTVFTYLLLSYFSFIHRFKQVISALYASGALISIVSLPFVYQVEILSRDQLPLGLLGWLVFIIMCWSFVVMAHILRQAIQKNLSTCLLLTFCYIYLSYQVINMVFPQGLL